MISLLYSANELSTFDATFYLKVEAQRDFHRVQGNMAVVTAPSVISTTTGTSTTTTLTTMTRTLKSPTSVGVNRSTLQREEKEPWNPPTHSPDPRVAPDDEDHDVVDPPALPTRRPAVDLVASYTPRSPRRELHLKPWNNTNRAAKTGTHCLWFRERLWRSCNSSGHLNSWSELEWGWYHSTFFKSVRIQDGLCQIWKIVTCFKDYQMNFMVWENSEYDDPNSSMVSGSHRCIQAASDRVSLCIGFNCGGRGGCWGRDVNAEISPLKAIGHWAHETHNSLEPMPSDRVVMNLPIFRATRTDSMRKKVEHRQSIIPLKTSRPSARKDRNLVWICRSFI